MVLRRAILVFTASLFAGASPMASFAPSEDAYPARPVTIIVPFPAGGSADLNARMVAEKLKRTLDTPVMRWLPAAVSDFLQTCEQHSDLRRKAGQDGFPRSLSRSRHLLRATM